MRKKLKISKKQCQFWHLKSRFKERFGLSLTKNLYKELKIFIISGKAKFLERESLRLTHFLVENFKGKTFELVYDSKRNQIVTVFNQEGYL